MFSLLNLLAAYFVVAYAFTWIFHGAILAFRLPFGKHLRSMAQALYVIGIAGPLVAAVLCADLSGAWAVRDLLSGVMVWRFQALWYLAAVLPVGAVYFICIGLNAMFGGQTPKQLLRSPSRRLDFMAVGQLWVVIGEEIGWRGFALPHLHEMFGWLGASLVLGFLWASWHLPMFFVRGSNQYGSSFLRYLMIITAWAVFMTMLYAQTGGSILICMVYHAAANIWAFTVNLPEEASRFILPAYLPLVIAALVLLPNSLLGL